MKGFCCFLFLALAPLSVVRADILFNETFSYPNGALTTVSSDWTTHSGTAGQMLVTSGVLGVSTSNTEDVNRLTGTTLTSGSIFAGFDFSVTAPAPAGGGDYEYFAHFGNGTSDFTARMDVTAAVGAGDFTVGIGATATADQTWATDLTYGVNYRAVIGYNRDTGIATLWVNPVDEMSTNIVSASDFNDVTAFYFRESTSSVGESIAVDNLIVATTFTQALGVPEPGSAMALAFVGFMSIFVRRRRTSN